MNGDDLRSWREVLGLTQAMAADALGLSKSGITQYEIGSTGERVHVIPKYVALACSAVRFGLKPYQKEEKTEHYKIAVHDLLVGGLLRSEVVDWLGQQKSGVVIIQNGVALFRDRKLALAFAMMWCVKSVETGQLQGDDGG